MSYPARAEGLVNIYIYHHQLTDYFVVSQLICVARHTYIYIYLCMYICIQYFLVWNMMIIKQDKTYDLKVPSCIQLVWILCHSTEHMYSFWVMWLLLGRYTKQPGVKLQRKYLLSGRNLTTDSDHLPSKLFESGNFIICYFPQSTIHGFSNSHYMQTHFLE